MAENMYDRVLRNLRLIPPISLVGNLLGVSVTFFWFAGIAPALHTDMASQLFWERLMIFLALTAVVIAAVIPVNLMWILRPLLRSLRKSKISDFSGAIEPPVKAHLHSLVSRILDVPVKLSFTTLLCWLAAAMLLDVTPKVIPAYYPWTFDATHKIVAWMALVGAPTTVLFVYFVLEWWVRRTTAEVFPHEVLASLPQSYRINVLPKLLVVTLIMGTIPVALMSHIVLSSISDIRAGFQSPESFLVEMPQAIWFLLVWAIALAMGLSVFMSKSVSEPLRYARAALAKLSEGDLDTIVPVLSNDDIGQMADQLNRMVREHKELDSLKDTFGRYLSQEVVDEILKSAGGVELGGELRTMTVMVADLRRFTPLAESHHPRVVLELLNRYFEKMTDIIISYEGTIDEFTGDGVLVFFGAPRLMRDHAMRAVACALEMQDGMQALNRENRALGLPDLHMGIGINSGELIVGNIGSEKRKKYGAVGSPINIAFRVEGHSAAGEVLLTPSVYDSLNGQVHVDSTREVQLKGLEKSILLYRVVELTDKSR